MSRSRKKYPWIQGGGDKDYKKIFNKKIRRAPLDYPSGMSYKKEHGCCSWEICDYRFIPDSEDLSEPDAYRWFMK